MPVKTKDFKDKAHPHDLKLSRLLSAPREKVFEALTTPEHLKHFWAPRPFTLPVCEVDLRPGGTWRYSMRLPEGWEHRCVTVYKEIEPPRKLVMSATVPDQEGKPLFEILQTITLEERAGKTLLTLEGIIIQANPGSEPFLAGAEEGTKGTLSNLAEYLASRK